MKKFFNKIKTSLIAFWIALISIPSKVLSQHISSTESSMQTFYWVEKPWKIGESITLQKSPTIVDMIIKIAPRLLVAITFIFWIISFIKIRKINDKTLRKKKTKKAVIIMIILITLITIVFLLSAGILECTTCWWII